MHIDSHLDVNVVAHESADHVTCMLQFVAPEQSASTERSGQTLLVVLDRSGSMHGELLEAAKSSLQSLVRRLAPQDRFGLIAFDDQAQIVVPLRAMQDHDRTVVHELIGTITSGGSTNLHAGYSLALREARRPHSGGVAGASVVIISDGEANDGIVDPDQLRRVAARAYRSHSVTSATIGLGLGYDETLLAAIAAGGSGNHRFAPGADELPTALSAEVSGLLDKSVLALTLRVTGREDHLSRVSVPQELPAWLEDDATVINVGDLYSGERRNILVRLHTAPLSTLGLATIADITVEFTALPEQQEHRLTLPISVNVVPGDEAAQRVPAPAVVVEELLTESAKAKTQASTHLRAGDPGAAQRDLQSASSQITSLSAALRVLRRRGQLNSSSGSSLQDALDSELQELEDLSSIISDSPAEYASKSAIASAAGGMTGRRPRVAGNAKVCPACGGELKPILWGLPAVDPGEDVILGGCCLPMDPESHGCTDCGWRGWL